MSSPDEDDYHSAKLRAMMIEVAVSPCIGTRGDSSDVWELAFQGFLPLTLYHFGALLIPGQRFPLWNWMYFDLPILWIQKMGGVKSSRSSAVG